ncbi:zinc finger protein [Trypanosoma melophagium]|uniref:zinc finger protein n=1 Tax=Trypanosoma melophagium TaxID=715481 RepID=UPI00351A7039|nr:zinc finger protein [Trypanosoma melophagium]
MRGSNSSKRARSESMESSSSSSNSNNNNNNNNNTNVGGTNNMNSDNTRSTPTPTPTTQPSSTNAAPPRDTALEEQMERLDVDEDFKASLRSMSPNSRREVIDDVIRTQQAEHLYRSLRLAAQLAPFRLSTPHGGLPDMAAMNVGDDSSDGETEVSVQPQQQQQPSGTGGLQHEAFIHPAALGLSLFERMQSSRIPGEDYMDLISVIGELVARRNLGITQDIDDMSYEQLLELQERIGYVSKGITKEQIRECLCDVARPSDGTCVVCQGEWEEGDAAGEPAVELKTCHHIFHRACIEQWLGSNKTCPVCKQEVV